MCQDSKTTRPKCHEPLVLRVSSIYKEMFCKKLVQTPYLISVAHPTQKSQCERSQISV